MLFQVWVILDHVGSVSPSVSVLHNSSKFKQRLIIWKSLKKMINNITDNIEWCIGKYNQLINSIDVADYLSLLIYHTRVSSIVYLSILLQNHLTDAWIWSILEYSISIFEYPHISNIQVLLHSSFSVISGNLQKTLSSFCRFWFLSSLMFPQTLITWNLYINDINDVKK